MLLTTLISNLGNIYVAVVDDDDSPRRSLSRLLRAAGFQPNTYPSAHMPLGRVHEEEGRNGDTVNEYLRVTNNPKPPAAMRMRFTARANALARPQVRGDQ